ncbi:MAG TPA: acylphosphatase [Beutenbergiaceae bacterium]|nr:acylphosphatase [Beutenbergiaceae bacterium]
MDTLARELIITGRVQGVNYRSACRRQARSLGVTGWVRNRPDGSVQARAQGSTEAVQQLIDWCRLGPGGAAVDEVTIEDVDVEDHSSFEVR